MTNYLTFEEKKLLSKEINAEAFYLIDYYLNAGKTTDITDDKMVGCSIGWSSRKVADYRRKLLEKEWLLLIEYKPQSEDDPIIIKAFIGKNNIKEYKDWLEKLKILDSNNTDEDGVSELFAEARDEQKLPKQE